MTESDYLARYTRIESESPWHGAKQFVLDTSVKMRFSNAVNNITNSFFQTHFRSERRYGNSV